MNRRHLKLSSFLLATVCAAMPWGQSQPLPQGITQAEKQAIISLLKDFSQQHPLLRSLNLSGDPLARGIKLAPAHYAGQIGHVTSAYGAFQQGEEGWRIRQFMMQPYREDLVHMADGDPLLSSDERAWDYAEAQFANEISQGHGLERGRATWLSFEGREKTAIRLTFTAKPKEHPVGSSSAGLVVQYRASDGALMEAFIVQPLAYTAGSIKITKERAIAVAGRSMLPKTDNVSARLAYLLPPYALSPGLYDRRTGKAVAPALKLMWEVTGPSSSAAVDPESGSVAWVFSEPKFPTEIVAYEPTDGDFPILAKESDSRPWPNQDIYIQVAGGFGIFLAVGLVINWLMKKDTALMS